MNINNRQLPVRRLAASWELLALLTCPTVGKDAAISDVRRILRRLSLQDQLKAAVVDQVLESWRQPLFMNTVSGADGRNFLVVPFVHSFIVDHPAGCELLGLKGGANPSRIVQYWDEGRFFRRNEIRPRRRSLVEHLSAIREAQRWRPDVRAASDPLGAGRIGTPVLPASASDAAAVRRAAKQLDFLRLNPEYPAVCDLAETYHPACPYGPLGRVRSNGLLHLFELGLLRLAKTLLIKSLKFRGPEFLTACSLRVDKQAAFDNGVDTRVAKFTNFIDMKDSGVKGSETIGLVLQIIVQSVGLLPLGRQASQLGALEDLVESYYAYKAVWYSKESLARLETLLGKVVRNMNSAFTGFFANPDRGFGRQKVAALMVVCTEIEEEGSNAQFHEGPTETAMQTIKNVYQYKTNAKGDVGKQVLTYTNVLRFVDHGLPALLNEEGRAVGGNMADGVAGRLGTEAVYKTRLEMGTQLLGTHGLAPKILSELAAWRARLANDGDLPDFVPPAEPFRLNRAYLKDRATVYVPNKHNAAIVGTDTYGLGVGDGMVAEEKGSRWDSVEILADAAGTTVVGQLRAIFTYCFHPHRLGSVAGRDREIDFVLVQHYGKPVPGPLRLFQKHRLIKETRLYELSSVVRSRWCQIAYRHEEEETQVERFRKVRQGRGGGAAGGAPVQYKRSVHTVKKHDFLVADGVWLFTNF